MVGRKTFVTLPLVSIMKIIPFLSLSALMLTLGLSGCKKTETENISRVKSYPAITLNGPAVTSINVGEAFTDLGASAVLNGATIAPLVSGRVDNTTPGFYSIVYRSANTEGDTVSTSRVVAVVPTSVNNIDQSGVFTRASNGVALNVTRIGKGLYYTENFGGVAPPSAAIQPAYFAQISPTSLLFPKQLVPGVGNVSFSGPTFTFNPAGLLTQFTYIVINPGFGAARRTFNRR